MRHALAAATLALFTYTAHGAAAAETLQAWGEEQNGSGDADDEDPNPFHKGRSDVTLGMLAGSYRVGPVGGPSVGMHLDAGWNVRRLMIYGEYDFMAVGEDETDNDHAIRGLMHRFGAMGRYALGEIGGGDEIPLQGQLWVEAGPGRQIVVWDKGGRLGRNDLALGIGGELNVMFKRRTKPSVLSLHYAFRMLIAREPGGERVEMATCGGPCDEPTKPSPWDLGLFFNLGLSWGR